MQGVTLCGWFQMMAGKTKLSSLDARLCQAALQCSPNNVDAFLQRGADIHAVEKHNVLQMVSERGATEVLRVLLDAGADVNVASDEICFTPLMAAARSGQRDAVQLLLEHGADPNLTCQTGSTALVFAAKKGHPAVVTLLLGHGSDANAGEGSCGTSLMWAARNGHAEVVNLLLRAGAKANAAGKSGVDALKWAEAGGHSEIARVLRDAGATSSSPGVANTWLQRVGSRIADSLTRKMNGSDRDSGN